MIKSKSTINPIISHKKNLENTVFINNQRDSFNCEPNSVTFFCPFSLTYSTMLIYDQQEIIDHVVKDNYRYRIILINNDNELFNKVLHNGFKTEFTKAFKIMNIQTDYVFSPINKLLFFNVGIIQEITGKQINKENLKTVIFNRGLILFSTNLNEILLSIFKEKFSFSYVEDPDDFFIKFANNQDFCGNMIDTINFCRRISLEKYETNQFNRSTKKTNTVKNIEFINNNRSNSLSKIRNNFRLFKTTKIEEYPIDSNNGGRNFSTDQLVYWILLLSMEKIEYAIKIVKEESNALKRMYMTISVNERKDFFRRLHTLETSVQMLNLETYGKHKMLKNCRVQFASYNKVTSNFYFKKNFSFFLEIIFARNSQAMVHIKKIKNMCKMIKENFQLIIENSHEKENNKRNHIMKVLAILTTIAAPFGMFNATLGMNVIVPYQFNEESEENSTWPFLIYLLLMLLVIFFELLMFWKNNWL